MKHAVFSIGNLLLRLVLALCLTTCIEPYAPQVVKVPSNFLVVEGSINSRGVSAFKLTRSVRLSEVGAYPSETKAKVFIEEEGGVKFALREGADGIYTSDNLVFSPLKRVRLHILTVGQKEYASDYVYSKETQPIDSVTWRVNSRGVQLAVNTHDVSGQSRFYRWKFNETWEFTAAFESALEFKNGKFVPRVTPMYRCWTTETSSAIVLGTTFRLGADVVSEAPLTLLLSGSTKLKYRYSALVKQYAISQEEYSYWDALRKNTENIGGLTDPLPSQLVGNIHCISDPAEPVLGYVGAQTEQEKRLLLDRKQLPTTWVFLPDRDKCNFLDTIPRPHEDPKAKPTIAQVNAFFKTGNYQPVEALYFPPDTSAYYLFSSPECVDCRFRGTNVKPSFW